MMNELIPRDAVKYICRKETVSTNPDDHKHSNQFMDFMDDDAVADFGRWQWKNGFNTALVAVEVELEKLPSAKERKTGRWIESNPQNSEICRLINCSECGKGYIVNINVPYEDWTDAHKFCVECGAKMGREMKI